jgi:ParB family chromosome partitioning protein
MLLENMQRNDLTVYEQANGFQLLLNFGETINDIAEKTGFSETTVRRRVKLLELDQGKFKASIERGATLQDFVEVSKIEDINVRNQVLDSLGTQNWKWNLSKALENQEMPQRKKELLEFLKDWAKPVKTAPNNSMYEHNFYSYKLDGYKKPKDAGKVEYCYVDNGNTVMVYQKTAASEKKKTSETEKSYKERDAQIKELTKRAYQLRGDFVKNFGGGKKSVNDIMAFAMIRLTRYGGADPDTLLNLLEIDAPNEDEIKDYMERVNFKRDLIFRKYLEQPERTMLLVAWSSLDSNEKYYESHTYNFSINHSPNPTLDAIYNGLIALGYEMSDEERALRDGTHKLFTCMDAAEQG